MFPSLPALCSERGRPDAGEEILTLVLVLAIKLDLLCLPAAIASSSSGMREVCRAISRDADSLALDDELANLVLLALLLGGKVLPAQDGVAEATGDIADRVRAGDELPGHRAMGDGVCEHAEGRMGRLGVGNEIRPSMAAGEAFADDLRGETDAGSAAGAPQRCLVSAVSVSTAAGLQRGPRGGSAYSSPCR